MSLNLQHGTPGPSAHITAQQFTLSPPTAFDFKKPQEWEKWITRFERYRELSGLLNEPQVRQVNTLIYCLGEEAEDILNASQLSETERIQYDKVKELFHSVFIGRRNIIYERAKFNSRVQKEDETVESFITALHKLAEPCNFGTLRDELIRDRIVIGVRDSRLAETLQLDPDLTLETATIKARQKESVRKQAEILRPGSSEMPPALIEAMNTMGQRKSKPQDKQRGKSFQQICNRCGYERKESHVCPAKKAKCRNCNKVGHFAKVCRSKRIRQIQENQQQAFLGAVKKKTKESTTSARPSQTYRVNLLVNGKEVNFKLDTGADESVMPHDMHERLMVPVQKSDKQLVGADGKPLTVKGKIVCTVESTRHISVETFYLVENLKEPLLGKPAITNLNLITVLHTVRDSQDDKVLKYRSAYPKLFNGIGTMPGQYTIRLKENCTPVSIKVPRTIALPLREKVQKELDRMLSLDIIAKIEEPTDWCSGMVVVLKKNGSVRLCVDLTNLNKAVKREKIILPSVEETLSLIGNSRYFSKLDANSGFWQVKLDAESAKLTTFITPFGRFYFKRLPFGISSAPEYFQRTMSQILEGLDGVLCHMDDILIFGKTKEEHDVRLRNTLERLQKAGVTLNEKCEFEKKQLQFLGHVIDSEGIRPDPDFLKAIEELPTPQDKEGVKRFLGMLNHVGKFIPRLSEKTNSLRELLKKYKEFIWTSEHQQAFERLKLDLQKQTVLAPYDANKKSVVSADASSYGLGAVLLQEDEAKAMRPIAFISKSLNETERRYAQIEKEAYAVTWACERLEKFLIGKQFHIETDHKPLIPLLQSKDLASIPARIQRFKMRLMRFHYTVSHVPGKFLATADTLSRAPLIHPIAHDETEEQWNGEVEAHVKSIVAALPATDSRLKEIKAEQQSDIDCQCLITLSQDGWPENKSRIPQRLTPYWQERATFTVCDGLLLKDNRIVIPQNMRNEILERIHEGHQGIVRCRSRAKESVWWPGINNDIETRVQRCHECITLRRPTVRPMIASELPERPWQKVGIDLFKFEMHDYLVVIDYYSRYIELGRLTGTSSAHVINQAKSVFARHGIPESVRSDSGRQFESDAWENFAKAYGFNWHPSSPHHHQSNGQAERAVDVVKRTLRKSADPYLAMLAYRATPGPSGYSPAELLMGRRLRTTLPTIQLQPKLPDHNVFKKFDDNQKMRQKRNYDRRHRARVVREFITGEEVYVTDRGQKAMIERKLVGVPRAYLVRDENNRLFRRNEHFLIPYRK